MNRTKAKWLGIFYTFLITVAQGTLFVIVLKWLLSIDIFQREILEYLAQAYDWGIPIAFVVSLFRARKIGEHIIYGQLEQNTIYVVLTTIALTMPLIFLTFFWLEFLEGSIDFGFVDIFEGIIYFTCTWIACCIVFFPSSVLFAKILEKVLKWHK